MPTTELLRYESVHFVTTLTIAEMDSSYYLPNRASAVDYLELGHRVWMGLYITGDTLEQIRNRSWLEARF